MLEGSLGISEMFQLSSNYLMIISIVKRSGLPDYNLRRMCAILADSISKLPVFLITLMSQ